MLAAVLKDKLKALLPSETTGFAIAYSGGADSTALLHALKDHPQLKCVYTLDHGLRAGSDIEARDARDFARSLGLKAELLTWDNDSAKTDIKTAIQERARTARYAIIGQACREAGIEYLVTGHHRDDQAETIFMRFEHNTGWRGAAGMAETTYAPLWPELALVTILRPLLGISQHSLADYNTAHNLLWAEDPSNKNASFERVRARQYLAQNPQMTQTLLEPQADLRRGLSMEYSRHGEFIHQHIHVDAHGVMKMFKICSPELLYHLLRVVSGEGRIINRVKISRLLQFMETARFTSATLGGALIRRNPYEPGFILCRDLGAVTGRKDSSQSPRCFHMEFTDQPQIWDGRYVFQGPREYSLNSAHAARDMMTDLDLKKLRQYPAAVRQTLPVVIKSGQILKIGAQSEGERQPYRLKSLVEQRLHATLGMDLM